MEESHIFIHRFAAAIARQGQMPFAATFEEMCQRIGTIPGAYCEPDGAIGWNPSRDGSESLGGTIHCIDSRVMCVELFARLHLKNWKTLHLAISSGTPTIIQLPEQGRFVSVEDYERLVYLF